MTPDEAVGPRDIRQLLDLLNSADHLEAEANDGEVLAQSSGPQQTVQTTVTHNAVVLPRFVEPNTPVPNDIENRFAAHIVHGMSKLRADNE
jgi:hypothetical protein